MKFTAKAAINITLLYFQAIFRTENQSFMVKNNEEYLGIKRNIWQKQCLSYLFRFFMWILRFFLWIWVRHWLLGIEQKLTVLRVYIVVWRVKLRLFDGLSKFRFRSWPSKIVNPSTTMQRKHQSKQWSLPYSSCCCWSLFSFLIRPVGC